MNSRAGCLMLVLLASAPEAAAQLRMEAQAALATRYVWRGITRSTKPSLQPQVAIGWARRGLAIDGGVMSALELGRGDPGGRSEVGIRGGRLGELNFWTGATVYDGPTAIQLGVIHYTYHGRTGGGGIGSGSNTTEIWAALDLRRERFSPRVEAFWDVGRVRGLYLTASSAVPLIAWPLPPYWMVYVEGDLGVNVGQDADPVRAGSGYFDDTGVTHARIAVRAPIMQQHGFTCALAYAAQLGFDRATRAGLHGDPSRGRLTHLVELRLAYLAGGGVR